MTGLDDIIVEDFLRISTLYDFLEKTIFRGLFTVYTGWIPVMWRENEGHYNYFWVRLTLEMYKNLIVRDISELDSLWEFTLVYMSP